jgi:hypothetical protein
MNYLAGFSRIDYFTGFYRMGYFAEFYRIDYFAGFYFKISAVNNLYYRVKIETIKYSIRYYKRDGKEIGKYPNET